MPVPFAGGRILFFVALAFTGRTGLVGGALGVIGQVVFGSAPFGTYLADTINDLFALAGWTGDAFFFSHVVLLVNQYVEKHLQRFFRVFLR